MGQPDCLDEWLVGLWCGCMGAEATRGFEKKGNGDKAKHTHSDAGLRSNLPIHTYTRTTTGYIDLRVSNGHQKKRHHVHVEYLP